MTNALPILSLYCFVFFSGQIICQLFHVKHTTSPNNKSLGFYRDMDLWPYTHAHTGGTDWTLVIINNNKDKKQEGKWRGDTGGGWRKEG